MRTKQSKISNLDISHCDQEPVQFIGSIQPFGILLVVDKAEFSVQQASQNSSDALGRAMSKILGFPLDVLFDASLVQALKSGQASIRLEKWNVAVQYDAQLLILEFEPLTLEKSANLIDFNLFNSLIDCLKAANSAGDLCRVAAERIQQFTNFDRVMIYKFHDDLHGEVIAETIRPGVDSFLGLHYPASDIPTPARTLFQKNWLRMIPDVEYAASPIVSVNPMLAERLDLTMCTLRSVSPIHIEYLKNMKVGASLSISLLCESKLWGLITCHHLGTKFVSLEDRKFCEFAGRLTSTFISTNEHLERVYEKVRRQTIREALLDKMIQIDDLGEALVNPSINLTHLIDSQGIAASLSVEGRWVKFGAVPGAERLDELVSWLAEHRGSEDIFHSCSLSSLFPPALEYKDLGSGLLAISIPKSPKSYVLCFRPELIRTVRWGGNPGKTVNFNASDFRLHPRKSFEAWLQTVESQSEPWKPSELDAALELRDSIIAIDLRRQFIKAQKAEAEIRAREEVMSILAHDLKNPISSIRLALALIPKLAAADSLTRITGMLDNIHRSTEIMMQLITNILDATRVEVGSLPMEKDQVEAREVLKETIEMLRLSAADKDINVTQVIPKEECLLFCDRGRLLQVFANLLSNAIKFTPVGGSVTIGIERRGADQLEFRVADTGPGIPEKCLTHVFDRFWQAKETRRFGAGLGLSIARGIIETSGGKIWVESKEGHGSTFYFTLPAVRNLSRAA